MLNKTSPNEVIQTVPKKAVYINLPFKEDDVQEVVKRRLDKAIRRTYYANAKLVFPNTTKRALQQSGNDRLPILDTSNGIYQFECVCAS